MVGQSRRVGLTGRGGRPVRDGLPRHTEHLRDVRGGTAAVEFQHGQSLAIESDIRRFPELTLETTAMPMFQLEAAHVDLP
jgi:hypothetical protein